WAVIPRLTSEPWAPVGNSPKAGAAGSPFDGPAGTAAATAAAATMTATIQRPRIRPLSRGGSATGPRPPPTAPPDTTPHPGRHRPERTGTRRQNSPVGDRAGRRAERGGVARVARRGQDGAA